MTAYEELAALARHGQDVIGAGDWALALELGDRWLRIADTLPATPPPEAREALEEAAEAIRSNVAAIEAALARAGRQLEQLQRGRRAVGSYAGRGRGASVEARG